MHCPTLSELPPPPLGKTGWPWTEESPQLPDSMPDGSPWPRVSIVTPSFNQGQFIEEAIRSVLLQGYPDLEYIIMDGGSTDDSVEIIKRYEPWLKFWASEKDNGQSDAINKGLELASGVIANWLNSDDVLCSDVLKHVAAAYRLDNTACLYNGSAIEVDYHGNLLHIYEAKTLSSEALLEGGKVFRPQPAVFFRRDSWHRCGKLKTHLYYGMDHEFYISCLLSGHSQLISAPPLAMMRIHKQAKTAPDQPQKPILIERCKMLSQLQKSAITPKHLKKYIRYGLSRESFRLFRISLEEECDLAEVLFWFSRAWIYSPRRTFYNCALQTLNTMQRYARAFSRLGR
jgi:glycosyltransferase involved in cell wall biosynthesis